MMKEECLNINELYARNCDFIRALNIEDEIKDSALMINDKLYKLSTTGFNLKKVASIYIENISQNTTDILIDTKYLMNCYFNKEIINIEELAKAINREG